MASFRIVRKRIRSGRTNVENANKPIWFAYEKMANFFSYKDGFKSTFKSEDISSSDASADDKDDSHIDCSQEWTSANFIHQQVTSAQKESEYSLTPYDSKQCNLQNQNIPDENVEGVREQVEEAYPSERNFQQKTESDYCDQYGYIVASRLRQLDEWHRDSAINKIDNILYEEKRLYLERLQCHSSRGNHASELSTGGISSTNYI